VTSYHGIVSSIPGQWMCGFMVDKIAL